MRSEHLIEPLPAVVRLIRYVKVPYHGHIPLTRRAVFARDGGRCVYCDAPATSLDHVVPRSRGGQHTWENVVSACRRCNHLKADRSVADLGWRMRQQPFRPTGPAWRILGSGRTDPRSPGSLPGGLRRSRGAEPAADAGLTLPVPKRFSWRLWATVAACP